MTRRRSFAHGGRRARAATVPALLALSAAVAGCSVANPPSYSATEPPEPSRYALLTDARDSIDADRPTEALIVLRPLLGEVVVDPTAHELAGKAYLRLSDFETAHDAFVVAARHYPGAADRQRSEDLTFYALGLSDLSRGDLAGARAQWAQIDHPRVRRGAFAALDSPAEAVALTALDGGESSGLEEEGGR